ncbi:sorting nexin-21-like [Lampetra fluviatilis]
MAMASRIIRKLRGGSKKSRGRGGSPGPESRPGDVAPGLEEEDEEEEEACRVAARLGGTLSFDSPETPRDPSSGDSDESGRATPEHAECGGLPAEVELAAGGGGGRGGDGRGGDGGGGDGGGGEQAAGDGADDSTRLTSALQASFRCKRDQQRRQQQRGDSLTFEVVAANVVQESGSKYVLYTVLVVANGCLDDKKASINRRYSDFSHLHKALLRSAPANGDKSDDNDDNNTRYRRQCARQLSSVSFPSKKIAGNFTAVTIARRSRAFEQYLSHITQIPSVRGTPSLWAFFCLPDLKAGHSAIRGGDYDGALQSLTNALHLQEKIIPPSSHKWELPPTLSALAACCQALGRRNEAQGHCQRALQVMGSADDEDDDDEDANTAAEDRGGPGVEGSGGVASRKANGGQWGDLLVALLSANVHLSWQLGLDKRESEARLQRLQGRRGAGCRSPLSLKEWVIQQHLQ